MNSVLQIAASSAREAIRLFFEPLLSIQGMAREVESPPPLLALPVIARVSASKQEVPISAGPFRNPWRRPHADHFGPATEEESAEPPGGVRLRIASPPVALDLYRLYLAGHDGAWPEDVVLYDVYDVWLVLHALTIESPEGLNIDSIGYEAAAAEDEAYAIDLLPKSILMHESSTGLIASGQIGIDGVLGAPSNVTGTKVVEIFGGQARLGLVAEPTVVGVLQIPLIGSVVDGTGVGRAACAWSCGERGKRIAGQQVFAQTILVRRGTREVRLRVRGSTLFRPEWTAIPASYATDWIDVTIFPTALDDRDRKAD
jgi:hypothetical protein